jgi:hypothetical protein
MVSAMAHVESFAVLGAHEVDSGRSDGPWFDGIDLLLRTSGNTTIVCGLRTGDYVKAHHGAIDPDWGDGYEPLPTTLDPSTVPFWDFNTLMWVGPSDHPCLVWTNAEFSLLGVKTTFGKSMPGNILRGPDGRGLPSPEQLGIHVPADLQWQPIS